MEENQNEEMQMLGGDGMSADKAKNSKKTIKRLFKELMQQKAKLIVIVVAAMISLVFTISAPLILGEGINILYRGLTATGNPAIDFAAVGKIVTILVGLYGISAIFNYIQQYIMATVSQNFSLSLRVQVSEKLNRLPLKFFDTHKKGDILSRVTNDIEKISDTLQEGLMQLITSILTVIGAVVLMMSISPILTVIAIVTIIIGMVATFFISGKSHTYFLNNQKSLGGFNSQIEEYYTGQMVIKTFNREFEVIEKIQKANDKLYEDSRKAQFISFVVTPAMRIMNQIGYVAIAVLGATFVINGKISIGSIQAFFQYVNQASEPLTESLYILNNMQAAIASAERIFEVLEEAEELSDNILPTKQIINAQGQVSFEHVKFGYSKDNMLMEDINISIKAGEKVAIVGPTGAGKTTLVNLLLRFYEVNSGRIKIDGVDIKEMKRKELRALFGMVLQDTWLFHGTIKENIEYARESATISEIENAAKMASVHHFIKTIAGGYQAMLEEDGNNISQGQKQLLTIARVILANPYILILDEATSSVDTLTEVEIQKAMDNLMKGRTSFIIAHRLSTIKNADLILVMQNGTMVEKGSHEELLNKSTVYAELYNSQFSES